MMKKYLIILVLIGFNFVVFGQDKDKIKQSDEIIYKLQINSLKSELNVCRNKDYWLSVLAPLLGGVLGGAITYYGQKNKNKSDKELKKIEFKYYQEQDAQNYFEREVMSCVGELISYYGGLRILVQKGQQKKAENLQEPLFAIAKTSLFTGEIANMINFHTKITLDYSEIEVHILKEYCNLLNDLYNCLLKQTIKKQSDIIFLKDEACKEEIEKLNEFFITNSNIVKK